MGNSSKLALSLLAGAALLAAPSFVWAQGAGSSNPAAAAETSDAIVVTALRQATNIQKTPVQVTALSAQKLQDAAVNQLNDLTYLTPSVKFTSNAGGKQTVIAMRGIGQSPSASAGPAAQLYEEEVPIAGGGLDLNPYDLSDIQVLEGPQGTLFGRNVLAGAVLVEPKLPSYQQDGYLRAGYGSYNYWTLEGAGNVTVIPDKVAIRVAGQIQRRDGYVRSLSPTIGPQGNLKTEAFRASVLFTPTSNFKDILTVDYFHEDDTGTPVIVYNPAANPSLPFPYPFYAAAPAIAAQLAACHHKCLDYGTVPQSFLFFRNEHAAVFNTTTWNVTPNIELKNIVGFQDTTEDIGENILPALAPLALAENIAPDTRLTEEVQIIGHAFENRLDARAGFYYESDWTHGPGGKNSVAPPISYQTTGSKSQSEAIYGDVNFNVTSRLKIRGGFRYTWDNQSACQGLGLGGGLTASGSSELCYADAAMPLGGPIGAKVAVEKDSAPTWSYGLDFQATDNIFLYFTGSRGYRSPAVNPIITNPCLLGGASTAVVGGTCANDLGLALGGPATGKSIDVSRIANTLPETIDNFEGGVKSQWRIGGWRMTFNFDAFHYNYTNVEDQISLGGQSKIFYDFLAGCPTCLGQTTFGGIVYSGGKVAATGFEGEFAVIPFRDFTFDAHFSYLDQKATVAALPPGFADAGLNAAQIAALTTVGKSPIQQLTSPTSPWAFTLAARYVLPWHPLRGDLVVNYDYFWTSAWHAQNLPVPGYDLHNIRVDWDNIGGSNISAGVWVRNLFDRDYELAAVNQPRGAATWGEPRMVGVDVTAKFH